MVSNLEKYANFNSLELDEKKKMVNAAIERDIYNEYIRLGLFYKQGLTLRDKIVYLTEKCPNSPIFKTISEDLIKIMSVMQNREIELKVTKREQSAFHIKGKISHYCNRLSAFPMYTYNFDNQITKLEMVENIQFSNMAISLFDCFNNRFLVNQEENSKIRVLK